MPPQQKLHGIKPQVALQHVWHRFTPLRVFCGRWRQQVARPLQSAVFAPPRLCDDTPRLGF